jgi:hypothetical protein
MGSTAKPLPTVYTGEKLDFAKREIENVLAFDQEIIINSGESKTLGTLDTSRFDKIRLVAVNEGPNCDVHVLLKIIEPEGNWEERIASLAEFTLKPGNQFTQVYDVPATKLEVSVAGVVRPGRPAISAVSAIPAKPVTKAEVEVLIYGQY